MVTELMGWHFNIGDYFSRRKLYAETDLSHSSIDEIWYGAPFARPST
jgi:hypothetical protein